MNSLSNNKYVGIDAGATLWKLVFFGNPVQYELASAGDIKGIIKQFQIWNPKKIFVTGGGAINIMNAIHSFSIYQVPEFEAWARGAKMLTNRDGIIMPEKFLLVSLGTGTFILLVDGMMVRHLSGLTFGGGTLLGLGKLLCAGGSFNQILDLATKGTNKEVDLFVNDIYADGGIDLAPECVASSFAKIKSKKPIDLLNSLIHLIGINVGIHVSLLAEMNNIDTVVIGGGAIANNILLINIIKSSLKVNNIIFISNGIYCGAAGAIQVE